MKPGGYLFIDATYKENLFYSFGEISYRLSGGRFPTFLNSMYSSHIFGRKQIFSSSEINTLLKQLGIRPSHLKKFNEISFPYETYLKKMFKSVEIVKLTMPIIKFLLFLFPIKNKMIVVGSKL